MCQTRFYARSSDTKKLRVREPVTLIPNLNLARSRSLYDGGEEKFYLLLFEMPRPCTEKIF